MYQAEEEEIAEKLCADVTGKWHRGSAFIRACGRATVRIVMIKMFSVKNKSVTTYEPRPAFNPTYKNWLVVASSPSWVIRPNRPESVIMISYHSKFGE
jgi:hypothetical protein